MPSSGLPVQVGCLVQNVGTANALYEAAKFGKPLYERVVTVTGAVNSPVNLMVRIGTPFSFLIEAAGGFKGNPGKVISGGPMMGLAQKSLDVAVTKGTSGVLVFDDKDAKRKNEDPCISCAMCVDVCPMSLLPTTISEESRLERWANTESLGALDCVECGSCSYTCPANRRLLDRIRRAKAEIMAIKRKGA